MSATWAEQLVESWDAGLVWTAEEMARLTDALHGIAELNDGAIHADQDIPDETRDDHLRHRAEEVLNAYAAGVVRDLLGHETPQYPVPTDAFDADLAFVQPMGLVDRVDINRAGAAELADLPGIGNVTAQRIIDYREAAGGIDSVWALRRIRGLSKAKVALFADKVYIRPDPPAPTVRLSNAADLARSPRFSAYVQVLQSNDALISRYGADAGDLKQMLIDEIEGLRTELALAGGLRPFSAGIRTSAIAERAARDAALAQHETQHGDADVYAVALRDYAYAGFVLDLLKQAQTRIWLMMFFFRFEDAASYPTDPHMAELVAAKERGVDVRVILDHQDEDDPRPSSLINAAAHAFLTAHDIPVRFDTQERLTHSKLLIVDDRHVVVGSHNWTAGSIYVYPDVSVYVNSAKLASGYRARYTALWDAYAPT